MERTAWQGAKGASTGREQPTLTARKQERQSPDARREILPITWGSWEADPSFPGRASDETETRPIPGLQFGNKN